MNYIAFLRGINVGGHKKIKMTELRALFKNLGYYDIITYIQSGNVVFKSEDQDTAELEDQITTAILGQYGFDVPTIVKKRGEIERILTHNPFDDPRDIQDNKVYFVLLKQPPKPAVVNALSSMQFDNEQLVVTPICVYLKCNLGAGKAKCNNNLIEDRLKVSATSRNHRTMLKLLELLAD